MNSAQNQITGAVGDVRRVCVTGSNGLVGAALVAALTNSGVQVTRFVRQRAVVASGAAYWNPSGNELDASALEGADAVVHLAGENIAEHRWTSARKQAIVDSRVKSTVLLADAIAACSRKPRVFVSASGVGIYGHRPDAAVDEHSLPGAGFLADVCRQWEAATGAASNAGVRVAHVRFGMVLATQGGALPKLLGPIRAGVGGPLGDGDQFVPWVTLDDAIGAIRFVIDNDALHGPINVVAPEPCSNRQLTAAIAKVCHRRAFIPVPAFALKLALGEMAQELLLSGANVRPKALEDAGFRFDHPRLDDALIHVLQPRTV